MKKAISHFFVLYAVLILTVPAAFSQPDEFIWAKSAGGISQDYGRGIATDGAGNSVVTGYFESTVTFGAGEANETSLTSTGSTDIFVAKYNSNSALLWAKNVGGTAGDRGYAVATDGAGNSVVTGYFKSTVTFGAGEANETSLTSTGSTDIFVAKYNPNGVLLWVKKAGSDVTESGNGVATDDVGNSVITGYFAGTATFGVGEANETSLTSADSKDIFVAKYNPDGTLLWAKKAGGRDTDEGNGIATDGAGNSLVTGHFQETATFGAGEPNETSLTSTGFMSIFVAKYNPDGALLWAKKADGVGHVEGNSVAADGAGNSVVTGWIYGTVTFGAGEANETTLTTNLSHASIDIFVAKYNPDGTLLWAKQAGGNENDATEDKGLGIATDGAGNCLVTGYFQDYVTIFGAGEANETTLRGNAPENIFIAKYNPDGMLLWAIKPSSGLVSGHGIAIDNVNNSVITGFFYNYPTTFGEGEANETTLTNAGEWDIFVAKYGDNSTSTNQPPTVISISVPLDPVDINNQPVSASATFSDPDGANSAPYTCTFDYGDGTNPEAGTVNGSTCTGPDHIYAEAGVYVVTVTVTDKDGASDSKTATDFIVIYDPAGGFVTGGGWIMSPEGAYAADPDLTGKANFGFVSKYKKGASVPTGNTEFKFKAGNLKFHSNNYDWLVIAGANAKYKGSGTINGNGNYGFMLTATDAAKTPSTDVDLFRIKIWDKNNGDGMVYDNKMGSNDDGYDGTEIGGGNIKIHKGGNKKPVVPGSNEELTSGSTPESYALEQNYPNPFNPTTEISFALPEAETVKLSIYNTNGQLIRTLVNGFCSEGFHSVMWNATDESGSRATSGMYVYVLQAGEMVLRNKMLLMK